MSTLFDMSLRAQRRDRAARCGPELFLYDRAFADCLDRLAIVQRRFSRALVLGCPNPDWKEQLNAVVPVVQAADPGALFSQAARGTQVVEDEWQAYPGAFDLIVAIGTLDTVNNLPLALRHLRHALSPDGLLIGAMSGGETLPRLRAAMLTGDGSAVSPRIHPRIEASALAPLLSASGFVMPVVDVDRVKVGYPSLPALVRDLRAMGATNMLHRRSLTPIPRASYRLAQEHFAAAGHDGRTVETFEILHFAAWTPESQKQG